MVNFFAGLPEDLAEEVFERLAGNDAVTIERIISKGHTTPENNWYDQSRNEWVMVVQGEAVLAFEEGESLRLKVGDYVDIPAHKKHRVAWTDPNRETLWLAVHY